MLEALEILIEVMLKQAIGLAQGSYQSADGLGSSQPDVSRPPPGTSGTTEQAVRVGFHYSPGALLPEYWRERGGYHFFLWIMDKEEYNNKVNTKTNQARKRREDHQRAV